MDTTSVILAVGSPPGRAPRGIVRGSGGQAFDLLDGHLALGAGGGTWRRGVFAGTLRGLPGELRCRVLLFPAPRSYTGDPCFELRLPGNPDLLDRVIQLLIVSGRERGIAVRRAEAGEFTARAFFAGRLGLTQAEGIAGTIAARSDAELRAARFLADGRLARLAHGLADDVAGALALVEAGIDFTDQEDVVPIAPGALCDRLRAVHDTVVGELGRAVGLEQIEAIPWVVLTGRPNAGKSTLFNALLGRRRAVVSSAAGTTRDVLVEPLTVRTDHGPAEVMLVDLAGLDRPASELDEHMQSAARAALERAELVLHCVAAGDEAEAPPPPPAALRVRTKSDLGAAPGAGLRVSATTGRGLDELTDAIAARLGARAVSLAADAVVLGRRHEAALTAARDRLRETLDLIAPARAAAAVPDPELVALSMRAALNDLAELAGDVTPDDVLGRIFSTFCVGK